ncbi:TetR/AcrR family transcriptional regulator [Pelagibacterium montanilacus]|uniref:TetR/AcrR family transcriptional regulator n=1 Tax=Pelagibacterium montanilacus TaxID=2185280 RepID=UPI000F8E9875|nr:TetR/AcrR family transcriptional regulator [Pelagibacterium montanilacus]
MLAISDDAPGLSDRQRDVLDAALALLVDGGDGLTMTGVARRASCSKETLYKWFGDREGLLTATVQWQAAKVRMVPVDRETIDMQALSIALEKFARDLLGVLAGDISVALNRLAVSHAGQEKRNLGKIVLENGRYAMGRRLKPVLDAGHDAGLLVIEDSEEAFRTFFGLVVRDVQIRLLLGDRMDLSETVIARDARRAREQFLALHGA